MLLLASLYLASCNRGTGVEDRGGTDLLGEVLEVGNQLIVSTRIVDDDQAPVVVRLVQDRLDRLGRRALAEDHLREVAGQQVHRREDHDGNDEECEDPEREPLQDYCENVGHEPGLLCFRSAA